MTRLFTCVCAAVASCAGSAYSAVINVPADQPTIQAAVNAATNGDEIVLAMGTYLESSIDLLGKEITIRSTDPDDPAVVAATIVDGGNDRTLPGFPQNEGSVFDADSGETVNTKLIGLTITGGAANDETIGVPGRVGGGVMAFNDSVITLDRCVFIDNWCSASGGSGGGAVYVGFASDDPVIINCTFINNESGRSGGAVFLSGVGADFLNCVFRGNMATESGGGAVSVNSILSDPKASSFIGCTFEDNLIPESFFIDPDVPDDQGRFLRGPGGAIHATFSPIVIRNCDFFRNEASAGGGAVEVVSGRLTLEDSVFNGNTATGTGSNNGGGLSVSQGVVTIITNTQFTNNTAGRAGGGASIFRGNTTITNSSFTGNTTGNNRGGGLSLGGTDAFHTVRDCDFDGNTAGFAGGGLSCSQSRFVITGCTFTNNTASGGGGLSLSFAKRDSLFADSIVEGNTAVGSGNFPGDGGGFGLAFVEEIPFNTQTLLRVENIDVLNNTADIGGGIILQALDFTEFTDVRVVGNTATISGGGLESSFSGNEPSDIPVLFNRCLFHDNDGGSAGGGARVFSGKDRFVNCVFTSNFAAQGGAIFLECSQAEVRNTTATDNFAFEGGVFYTFCSAPPADTSAVTNGVFFNNVAGSGTTGFIGPNGGLVFISNLVENLSTNAFFTDPAGVLTLVSGNIDGDPLFVDADGPDNDPLTFADNDLTLGAGSPAIDAGSNVAVPAGVTTDFLGLARFADDPNTSDTGVGPAPIVDMGAFEVQSVVTCPADVNGSGFVDTGDLLLVLANFNTMTSDGDADGSGTVDTGDLLIVLASFNQPC